MSKMILFRVAIMVASEVEAAMADHELTVDELLKIIAKVVDTLRLGPHPVFRADS